MEDSGFSVTTANERQSFPNKQSYTTTRTTNANTSKKERDSTQSRARTSEATERVS